MQHFPEVKYLQNLRKLVDFDTENNSFVLICYTFLNLSVYIINVNYQTFKLKTEALRQCATLS